MVRGMTFDHVLGNYSGKQAAPIETRSLGGWCFSHKT